MANESGDVIRMEANGGRASNPEPFAVSAPTERQAETAQRGPARMKGHRVREVPREVLKHIVLKYISDRTGVDAVDLASRADVHFFDALDKDVPLDAVVVTWDE